MRKKTSLIWLSAAAGLWLGALTLQDQGLIDAYAKPAGIQHGSEGSKGIALFRQVLERVRADYIDKPEDAKLIEAAINGMLAKLDPHSDYLDAKSYHDLQTQTRGEFGGVGIRVSMEDGIVKVVEAIEETPAARAGILADDVITHLDDQAIKGLGLSEVVDRMRGPVNSDVRLRIVRTGESEPRNLLVKRDNIKVRPVQFRRIGDDVAYIKLSQFNRPATDGVRTAIKELSRGIGVRGFVLDMRNNPGGLIDQAVAVAESFIDKGEIVQLRGRYRNEDEVFDAKSGPGDLTKGRPIVVLINGGSASSAEIVAGALQDHKRATIVGTRSYGKGSVQSIIPLGPSNGALRLTTARYYTPSGRSIQAQGIKPDIEVMQDVPKAMLASAEMRGEATLPGHLKGEGEDRSASQSYVPADQNNDKALHVALELLRGAYVSATAPSAQAGTP